ncbi:hypothetical protein SCHPADRAFT_564264 [Schizopora paradoxa]|uniref:Uncharacterized protein n=1 Tax=Schizopora paradoxa TaxID=27342 RepID=A0A0H2RJ58_9AGAM|nr:hypothetical protein SCHPADRAFT_564264 [Schizopora paradoxa]
MCLTRRQRSTCRMRNVRYCRHGGSMSVVAIAASSVSASGNTTRALSSFLSISDRSSTSTTLHTGFAFFRRPTSPEFSKTSGERALDDRLGWSESQNPSLTITGNRKWLFNLLLIGTRENEDRQFIHNSRTQPCASMREGQ